MKFQIYLLPLLSLALSEASPSLTIYNENFARIRQLVPLELKEGSNKVSFDKVTSQLEPDSVELKPLSDQLEFSIRERSYSNPPFSQSFLLDQFEGQEIKFLLPNAPSDTSNAVLGKIVRSGYNGGQRNQEPVILLLDQLRFGLPGTPLFPPESVDAMKSPTLNWEIESKEAQSGIAELSYLSQGLSWSTNYNLIIKDPSPSAHLNSWVTLSNSSGTAFEDVEVRLLAGSVNHNAAPLGEAFPITASVRTFDTSSPTPQTSQRPLGSYHSYDIDHPISLKNQELKQIKLIESSQVEVSKAYVYEPRKNEQFYGSPKTKKGSSSDFDTRVSIYWSFENTVDSGLGVPLPKGKIRLYRETSDSREFMGEDVIKHTPKEDKVEFYTGDAFDLIGERKIVSYKPSKNSVIEQIKLKVRNHSEKAITVEVREALTRWHSWTISNNSQPYTPHDSQHISFSLELEGNKEQEVSYTATYNWEK